jgi:cytochrome c oxidase assembly factor CtaG
LPGYIRIIAVLIHSATSINQFTPLAPLIVTAVAYGVRARTLARSARRVSPLRQLSFYAGLAAIGVGLASPLDAAAEHSLIAHTSVHMLIGQIGAFFTVAGLTGGVLQPLLRIGWVSRLRVLSDPRVALPLWAANLLLWHTAPLFELGLTNDFAHVLQHSLFIAVGINLWMPLVGPLPQPSWFGNAAKCAYVTVVFFTMMVLGNALVWGGEAFYDAYRGGDGYWGLTPTEDQSVAGGIMMIVDTFFTLGLLIWLFVRWASESEQSQELIEYARERGVELPPGRSERAAAAGTAAHVRRRVERSQAGGHKRD